ncbi:MAG TPA: hypothetical protein VMU83_10690 [Hanamia sp.]|nr:hypothetical protein [Hanamia sp.]
MEQKNYKIRIDGIDIISKTMYKFQLSENDIFNHQLKTQAVGDENKNLAVVFVQSKINKLNEPTKILAEITIAIGFVIEDFKEVFPMNENGKHIIPSEVENLLKSMSISTLRGIMFSEFRGTLLHKAVLPIILMDSLKPIEGNLFEEVQTPEEELAK